MDKSLGNCTENMDIANKSILKKHRKAFLGTFMLTYLLLDLTGIPLTWFWLPGNTHMIWELGVLVGWAFITLIMQAVIGLGAWFIYKKCENKWNVLFSALLLLSINGFFSIIGYFSMSEGWGLALFSVIPIIGSMGTFGLRLEEGLEFLTNHVISMTLVPTLIYTFVLAVSLLTAQKCDKVICATEGQ